MTDNKSHPYLFTGCKDCDKKELDWRTDTCEVVFEIGLSGYEDYCDTLTELSPLCGIRDGDTTGTVFGKTIIPGSNLGCTVHIKGLPCP